ncbi:hepatic lectin-like [Drosophila rhopaloa]|uniref:C-type lectin domain-containing protein n=2 Tax=Drosophila rhopaloa TaxID=1041015 RepID=A0ABM5JBB7_DRORH|nr:hepatic lectin-like [Drosophila rhopaloa]
MFKFEIYLVYAFVVCNLYSIVKSQENVDSVCILKDAPSQCGAFCLSAQRPFIDHNYKVQRQMDSISEILNENQKRLDRIEEAILAVQKESRNNFETIQQVAVTSQETKMNRIEKGTLETQASMERIQRENQDSMDRIFQQVKSNSMGFQWIESRYFYIENNFKQTWINAEDTCRKMGGHLAAFQNQKELSAVTSKLHQDISYWVGITDREKEGEFVTASGNPPIFLTWNKGEPNNYGGNENCVNIWNGIMNDIPCELQRYYICQSDNKV